MSFLHRKGRSRLFFSSILGRFLWQLSQHLQQLSQQLCGVFIGLVLLSLPAFGEEWRFWIGAKELSFPSSPDYGSRFDLAGFFPEPYNVDEHELVPQVHLPAEKQWEQLNRHTWDAFFNNIQSASTEPESKAFVSPRVNASFSRNEFFWDQAFISLGFGLYAHRAFNSLGGLNCFYRQQHPDGFIPREIAPDGSEVRYFPGASVPILIDPPYALDESGKLITDMNLSEDHEIFTQNPWKWSLYESYRETVLNEQSKVREGYCEENNSNPPLAAHAEWRHFLLSRNLGRLSAVYDVLAAHTEWLENNREIKEGELAGLFRQGNMGSGMDNLPSSFLFLLADNFRKVDVWDVFPQWQADKDLNLKQNFALFDISAQMKLHYDAMASISEVINKEEERQSYQRKADRLKARINECLWNEKAGFYFNAFNNCNSKSLEYALSAYWGLYAEIASPEQAEKMLKYLKDEDYFNAPMPFPALARSDPLFYKEGDYWRGGVWPPLVYMTLKGLMKYAESLPEAWTIAVSASEKYLTGLAKTMFGTGKKYDSMEVCWKDSDGVVHTCMFQRLGKRIYEYNSPTTGGPGLRRDVTGKDAEAKGNFVGWGGLGPVGVMQEVAVGLDVHKDELVWYLNRTDGHGIKRFFIGSRSLDITVAARAGEQLRRDHISVAGLLPKDSPVRRLRVVPKDNPENAISIPLTAE